MSRSGYSDCLCDWSLIRYRGAVASAIRGKRGQAFLRELLAALDALPTPELIEGKFDDGNRVCALGAVARARSVVLDDVLIDAEGEPDQEEIARRLNIARALAAEIMYENDEYYDRSETGRFRRVRAWVVEHITRA